MLMALRALLLAGLLMLSDGAFGLAGPFGRNKVRYQPFEWKVLKTDHFEIFYYPAGESLAYEACDVAERAWQSQIEYFRLLRAPQRKVPIFLYATFHDFIQTNVIPGPIGEGVGGVTEAYKTRVVLPLGPSAAQRRHVIIHELVHAHQFFILYGEGVRSYSLYKSVLVPLWFMEGMAEHVADEWTPAARMVLRDAVLHDRLPPLWLLHHFNHLEPHDTYLGYQAGHAAMDFLADQYGGDKGPAILKAIEEPKTFAQVFHNKVGVSLAEFDRRWRNHLKETFWSETKGRKDAADYGRALVAGKRGTTVHNTSPVPSPKSGSFVFLSDRQGFRNVFTMRKGRRPHPIFSNAKFTSISSSPPAWSPDGKHLVVTVKEGRENVLAIVDARRGRVRRRLKFPFLDVGQAVYTPDGSSLAFVGFNGTAGEIYLVDIESGTWRQLTWDGTANSSPAFTPDGERLLYASEGPDGSVLKVLEELHAERPRSRQLRRSFPVKGKRPDVSPDGKWILFDSGENGIPNLYAANFDGSEIRQLTDARTGIFAGRWSWDGQHILAVTLAHGSQNIHVLKDDLLRMGRVVMHPSADLRRKPGAAREAGGQGAVVIPVRSGKAGNIPASQLAPPVQRFTPGHSMVSAPPAAVYAHTGWIPPGLRSPRMSVHGRVGFRPVVVSAARMGPGRKIFLAQAPGRLPLPARQASGGVSPPPEAAGVGKADRPAIRSTAGGPVAPLSLSILRVGPDIQLSWSVPAISDSLTRYEVYRTTQPGKLGQLLTRILMPSPGEYRDTSWQYREFYYYRVRGFDSAGRLCAAGETTYSANVEIWPSAYEFKIDKSLVDLFVLVGSVSLGAGASFAGYGVLQLSDVLGNNRLLVEATAIPSWMSRFGVTYVYEGLRPDIAISVRTSQNRFVLYPSLISTENLSYPPSIGGALGISTSWTYPFSTYTRVELAADATQITETFTDRRGFKIFPEKTSLMFPVSASVVRDTTRWRRLLAIGGYKARLGVSQTVPVTGGALRFTEYNVETQWFKGLSDNIALAVRWFGAISEGHDQRTYYLGGRYLLRAHGFASLRGNGALLGNHEVRVNLVRHLNIQVPLVGLLFTDIQGVGFFDVGTAFDTSIGLREDSFRMASVGGGLNLIGFMMQSRPMVFSVEVARRINERQARPTVYGRLGSLF